jgi:hypothetical protein
MTPVLLATFASAADWQPKSGPLMTRWARDVRPDRVLPEYPRPQFVRPDWQNLNGLWEYAVQPKDAPRPTTYSGSILVPFPIESALSGVMERITPDQRVWYRRTFTVPADWQGRRLLIHFGAVDWEATVWLNGHELGTHLGGYDPFSFDATDALNPAGPNELIVAVWDPTDAGRQPRGKQVNKPHGIWYTPTTGIWQTVWLEPVPAQRLADLALTPDIDQGELRIALDQRLLPPGAVVEAVALAGGKEVARATGAAALTLKIATPRLWSPDAPFLYDLKLTLRDKPGGAVLDEVTSYFAMRKISRGPDADGVQRLLLNNQPLFQYGLLDQGFWPDGLYTAPTDEALRFDIEFTRQLGFNTIRKHVKVEPARWYYWCDKLGLLVWQDMPNGTNFPDPKPAEAGEARAAAAQFELELQRVITALRNYPCIVMWVPFNEGWGQYDTARITRFVQELDNTRLVNNASGWTDAGVGDVLDIHVYPGPLAPPAQPDRAGVLGEFGGLGLPLAGHTWQAEQNWGYRTYTSQAELNDVYLGLITRLRPLITLPGLAAAIYTQTTDVEIEVNGLLTYDRAVVKIDQARAAAAHRALYLPPPRLTTVVPTSEAEGLIWRYTTAAPADGWQQPDFDDSAWSAGPGVLGRQGTPGAVVRTEWHTDQIWARRVFELPATLPTNPFLRLHHDEDCVVYINGHQAAAVSGFSASYVLVPLADPRVLRPGRNTFAIHCRQTDGGQAIDVGIVDVTERP